MVCICYTIRMKFNGAKIALIHNDNLVALLRDDKPGLEDAAKWDLPGGGREGNETPEECALREVQEELHINLDPKSIVWKREYDSIYHPGTKVYFLVATLDENLIANIQLGDENQKWELMKVKDFLGNPNAIEYCKDRLRDYFRSNAG